MSSHTPGTITTTSQAAPARQQCVGIRTHRFGSQEMEIYEALLGYFAPEDIFFVFDETHGPVVIPDEKYQKVGFDKDDLKALSLFSDNEKIGWLCGDYFYYFLRRKVAANYYWLIEPDVKFTHKDIGNFFRLYANMETDFIAPYFGKRAENWPWYKTATFISKNVYGCVFPITRISARAIDALLPERQKAFPENACPNDEAFVATTLMEKKFSCYRMDMAAPQVFASFDVMHPYAWQFAQGKIPPGRIVHPAVDMDSFWGKFRNILGHAFGRSELHKMLTVGTMGGDKQHIARVRFEFLAHAAHWFDAQVAKPGAMRDGAPAPAVATPNGKTPQPLTAAPSAGGVRATRQSIVSRKKQHAFSYSASQDFTLAKPEEIVIGLGGLKKYTPYCYDYTNNRFVLVDTSAETRLAPFFYQAQFRHASETISIAKDDLTALLSGNPALLKEDPVLVFSIGRCGSTLFSKLSSAAGLVDYSEPDIFAGITPYGGEPRAPSVLRGAAGSLALAAGTTPNHTSIKFRSDSNGAIKAFLNTFPAARYIFLTRNLRDWSASFISKFNWSNEQLLGCLVGGARAQKALEDAGATWTLLRYEDFSVRPELVYESLTGRSVVPADVIARLRDISGRNSQVGSGIGETPLGQDATAARVQKFLDYFRANAGVDVSSRFYIDAE